MRAAVLIVLLAFATLAAAQLRTIPKDARRAEMRYVAGMIVEIDETRLLLSPAVRIRDTMNMIMLPGALPEKALVKYRLDDGGMVREVWILTGEEILQDGPPAPKPDVQDGKR